VQLVATATRFDNNIVCVVARLLKCKAIEFGGDFRPWWLPLNYIGGDEGAAGERETLFLACQ
jgi:hypothetical protein